MPTQKPFRFHVAIYAVLILALAIVSAALFHRTATSFSATPEDLAMCKQAGDCTLLSEKRVGEVVEQIANHAAQTGFLAGRKSCERGSLSL